MPKITDKELADKVCAEVATRLTRSCTIVINVDANGDAEYEYIDNSVPTNPETGKPYFETRDDAWSGEWVAGEAKSIPNSEFGGDDE